MERARILIVDDEIGPREALKMILKDRYQLMFAQNGREAVDISTNGGVDLVIMDIKMPVMDGMEALKAIKSHNPMIGVIMVTGYGTIDTAVEAMKFGAFDFISKPFDSFGIIEKVENALADIQEKKESQQMLDQIQEASDRLSEQQESLQRQIVQLSKLSSIGMLAQGLAHNLSSPLLIILGRAELMKEKLIDLRSKLHSLVNGEKLDEKQSLLFQQYDHNIKDTEIIIDNVNRLTEIIQNMMTKSRQDQAEEIQALNLSRILSDELKFLEADLYYKHQVQKDFRLADDIPLIKGIYSDFSQTFLNLIKNAIEAMYASETKKLGVNTYHDQEFVYVEITDTGCGIDEENLDKIFQPYFTTKKSTDNHRSPVGTGLGLHMVKLLMEPYHTQIDVMRKAGTTSFVLKIPHKRGIETANVS